MAKTNEVLKQYFNEQEINEIKSNKPDKYNELSEKLKSSENKTQVELNKLKQELENLSLDEKINKVLNLSEESEKNQKPSKEQEKKAKKESEEKGFSWEKISKIVEEKGGWFSWAGISAGIGAIFSNIFSGFFDKIEKGVTGAVEEVKNVISELKDGETKGTFSNLEYTSEKSKFKAIFDKDNNLNNIIIDGKKYTLDGNFKLKEEKGKLFLVEEKNIFARKYSLDYLGAQIDSKKIFSGGSFDIKMNDKDKSMMVPDFIEERINDKLVFTKDEYLPIVNGNTIKSFDTTIKFDRNIDLNGGKLIEINEIEISGKKYIIEPKGTKFNLEKNGTNYTLNNDVITWINGSISISNIKKQINKGNKNKKNNGYYLFKPILDLEALNNNIYIKEIN